MSCGTTKPTHNMPVVEESPISFTELARNSYPDNEMSKLEVFTLRSKSDEDKLRATELGKHALEGLNGDYSNEILLVVGDETRGSAGHSIRISEVKSVQEEIVVIVNTQAPSGDAASVMTRPYSVVRIPITEGTAVVLNATL